jgi:L-histidine N-alpha-methyltransferase
MPDTMIAPPDTMRADVAAGLARPQKELLPKYFYDRRGSELFEEITRLPEYYLTRAERSLLRDFVPGWVADREVEGLIELGAGNADKTRIILDAMAAHADHPVYVPVDISGEFLESAARAVRQEYPSLSVEPVIADFTVGVHPPDGLPRPTAFALLGSTIGNFKPDNAVRLLAGIAEAMRDDDLLLLGLDLKKDRAVLEAAYDDASGVTAAFNLNVLRVLNRELGTDFQEDGFQHRALYNDEKGRIEMHLVARRDMDVHIPEAGTFHLRAGETIRTELSHKYDRATAEKLLQQAGLALDHWHPDADGAFALTVARSAT